MDATRSAIEKAEGFLTLGMGLDAWETLEDLPAESKNDQRVLELKLACLCNQSSWEKAIILDESITAALPRSALALFWLGVAHCQLGDVHEARKVLGRAVDLDPSIRERLIKEPLLEAIW